MVADGIVEATTSELASNVVLARKKDGIINKQNLLVATLEVRESMNEAATEESNTIVAAQKEDHDLRIVRGWIENVGTVPGLDEILQESATVKVYWHQRESLCIKEGVIYRRRLDGIEQLLLPKALR